MRTFSEDLLESLTDDELLQGQGELARLVAARGKAKADAEYEARGLSSSNGFDRLQLNVKALGYMGRDSKGAPLPPKGGKKPSEG